MQNNPAMQGSTQETLAVQSSTRVQPSVKELRKKAGLTQQQLADACGANIRWVQKIERGDIKLENVTFLKAIRLVKVLYENAYADDQVMQECVAAVKTTYIMARELLEHDPTTRYSLPHETHEAHEAHEANV